MPFFLALRPIISKISLASGFTVFHHNTNSRLRAEKKGLIMNIYVGNLSCKATEDDVKAAFSRFGEVTSAGIIRDKFSGQSKGFGFVEMSIRADGEKAIKELDGTPRKGREIKVNEARPREKRQARRRSTSSFD
ncbi:MAG: RNA-binding protein [Pseudomonadota bacterium]